MSKPDKSDKPVVVGLNIQLLPEESKYLQYLVDQRIYVTKVAYIRHLIDQDMKLHPLPS